MSEELTSVHPETPNVGISSLVGARNSKLIFSGFAFFGRRWQFLDGH